MSQSIEQRLFALQDAGYKAFHCALMPTVDPDRVIGVRTPALRALAKELKGEKAFLLCLPHSYYEENNLHGYLISSIQDFGDCVREVERFLPYVDNWATCDCLRPKCFAKHTDVLLPYIRRWLASEHIYTIRFGMGMLMTHYLEAHFSPEYLAWVAAVQSQEYYVNMMAAWYFATALAKQWDESIAYLENRSLSPWVHNKTIQKAVESFRITPEQKTFLKTLKLKRD